MSDTLKAKSRERIEEMLPLQSRLETVSGERKHKKEQELLRQFRNVLDGIPDYLPSWEFNAVCKLASTLHYLDDVHKKTTLKGNPTDSEKAVFASLQRSYIDVMVFFAGAYGLRKHAAALIRREAELKGKKKTAMNLAHWGDEQHLGTTPKTNTTAAEFFGYGSDGTAGILAFIDDVLGIEDGKAWQRDLLAPATEQEVKSAMKEYTRPWERPAPKLPEQDAGDVEENNQAKPQPENIAEKLPERLDGRKLRGHGDEPGQERES